MNEIVTLKKSITDIETYIESMKGNIMELENLFSTSLGCYQDLM